VVKESNQSTIVEVIDQVIQYTLGFWGEEAASEVDANTKEKILARPRAKEFAGWQPPQPTIEEIHNKLGGPGLGDDELLMRYVVGKDDVDALKSAAGPKGYVSARHPLVILIQELSRRAECSQIYIRKPGLSLTLEKREAAGSSGVLSD
jgi:oxaloacetate decarboxylase alpha subunit